MVINGLRNVFSFFTRPRRRGLAWYDLVIVMILVTVTIITFVKPSSTSTSHASSTAIIPTTSFVEKAHTNTGGPRYRADIAAPPCNDTDIACYGGAQQPNGQNKVTTPAAESNFFFIFTDPRLTLQQSGGVVQIIWGWMLGVVDAFVVLVLMLNGLKAMVAGTVFRYANAIESLPGALLSLIASHGSMIFITAILALNNILAVGLYNTANNAGWANPPTNVTIQTCNEWFTGMGAVLGGTVGAVAGGGPVGTIAGGGLLGWIGHEVGCHAFPHKDNANTTANDTMQGIPHLTGLSAIFDSLTNLLGFITGMLILVIIGQMILRIFLMNLYAAAAPICIACWAIPGKVGQPVTQMWFKGFISVTMAQFAQVLGLIIGQVFTAEIINYMATIPSLNHALTSDTTLVTVIAITRLWFIIRIPSLFETAPTRAMGEVGHTIVQAAGTMMAMQMAEAQFVFSAVQTVIGMAGSGASAAGAAAMAA